jgi:hypothetical protein
LVARRCPFAAYTLLLASAAGGVDSIAFNLSIQRRYGHYYWPSEIKKLECLSVLHTFLRLQTRQAETARGRGVAADMVNVGFELVVGIVVEEGLSLLFCGWLIRYRTL